MMGIKWGLFAALLCLLIIPIHGALASPNRGSGPAGSFTKQFFPATISVWETSTLVFNLSPNGSVTDLTFTDNLPAGVVIADPANISNFCGGTLTAVPGTSTITLTGGSANWFCSIALDVTGTDAGTHTNTTSECTSSAGSLGTAINTLTVNPITASLSATTNGNEAGPVDITYTVTLNETNNSGAPLTFNFNTSAAGGTATASSDYTPITNGTISVPDSAKTGSLNVTVIDDFVREVTETVDAIISNPSNPNVTIATASATGSILDDEYDADLSATRAGNEAGPVAIEYTVTLNRANNSGAPLNFAFNTGTTGTATAGSDYTGITNGTISVVNGASTGTIDVVVLDDSVSEGTEIVDATISSPPAVVTINTASATGSILNDDFEAALSATQNGNEDGLVPIEYTVTLSHANTTGSPITFTFNTDITGTATANSDYTAVSGGSISVADGATTGTLTVAVLTDALDEATETVDATISNPSGANVTLTTATATGNILDDHDADDFVITVKTDNPGDTSDTEFRIPTAGSGHDYNVDCDSDGSNEAIGVTGDYTCNYGAAGTYTIRIKDNRGDGTGFNRIWFDSLSGGDRDKILSVDQWGTAKWSSMNSAFRDCTNLTITASDAPDLSSVTDMRWMFSGATAFNQDIGAWDVSKVRHMQNMFDGATLSTSNYDALLTGWDAQNLQPNINFHGGNSTYCNGETARANMENSDGWNFTDGGKSCVPEIYLQRPVGTSIADGGTDDQGVKKAAEQVTLTYTIENGGVDVLTVSAITSASATNVTVDAITPGSPLPFTVAASGGTQTFTVQYTPAAEGVFSFELDISSDDPDAAEANYDLTVSGTADGTAPTVTDIDRADPDPTNATSVDFTVTFSEVVYDIETGDFALATTGNANGTISSVSAASGDTVTVTVDNLTGAGTLGLNFDFDALDSVADAVGNPAAADFTGQVYTFLNLSASLDGSGNLLIDESGGDSDDDLTIRFDGSNISITHASGTLGVSGIAGASGHGTGTITIPVAQISGSQIIFNAGGGDDTLTVDFGDNSNPFSKQIVFNGQGQTSADTLALTGTANFAQAAFGFINANDGTITVTGNPQITYTGLEPVTFTGTASDVILNYSAASETITVTDAGGGQITVDSTVGETVTFNDPTGSLTINAGGGDDTIDINGISLGASLLIDGQTGTNNAGLTNVSIIASGSDGLSASNLSGLTISGSTFSSNNGDGIVTIAVETISLTDTDAQFNTGDGVDIPTAASVVISGGDYSSNDYTGIKLDTITGAVTVSNATADDHPDNGVESGTGLYVGWADSVTVTGGSYSGNELTGLDINWVVNAVTLTDVTADNNTGSGMGEGLQVTGAGSVEVNNGSFSGNELTGLNLDTVAGSVTLNNVTANNNTGSMAIEGEGLNVFNAGTVTVNGGNFNGNEFTGIDIDSVVGAVTLSNVTADGNTGSGTALGLYVADANSVSITGGAITNNEFSGIYLDGDLSNTIPVVTLTGLTLTGNGADSLLEDVDILNLNTAVGTTSDTVKINTSDIGGQGYLQHDRNGSLQDTLAFNALIDLSVYFDGGQDTVHVAPHADTAINLDGGDPTSSPPGDTLNFVPPAGETISTTFSPASSMIATTGGYEDVTFEDFESYSDIGHVSIISTLGEDETLEVTATNATSASLQMTSGSGTGTVNISNLTSLAFIAGDGNDQLIINHPAGSLFAPPSGIYYDGQGARGDSDTLTINGGTATTLTYTYTNDGSANDNQGTVNWDGTTLTYTGLEPITSSINATNVILNYSAASETITVSDAGGGQTTVDSTAGEITTFDNPSGTLAINAGAGDDIVNITSLAASFPADLTIDGQGDTDIINLDGSLSTAGKDAGLTAETINLAGTLGPAASAGTFSANGYKRKAGQNGKMM